MTTTQHDALQPFDGTPVVRATIQITKAGDGLSDALKVEPREFHLDDEVYVVLRTRCSRVLFKPMDKDDASMLVRIHTLEAGDATIVDAGLVEQVVAETAQRVAEMRDAERRAKEAEAGIQRLSFSDDENTLAQAHAQGEHHEGMVDGCPVCAAMEAGDSEAEAMADAGAEPGGDDGDEDEEAVVLRRNHMAGTHKDEPMPGCPICDQEAVAGLMGGSSS